MHLKKLIVPNLKIIRAILVIGIFVFLIATPLKVAAYTVDSATINQEVALQGDQKIVVYFFWGDGCPHCAEAKPFLENLAKQNPSVEIKAYEVWYVEENQLLMAKFGEKFGFTPRYVPTIIIGDRVWEGYSDEIEQEIDSAIGACLVSSCPDKGADLLSGEGGSSNPTEAAPVPTPEPTLDPKGKKVNLPLIGEIDLSHQSLFLSTLLISLVDGFNPCSIWVLSMLLAITLHTGSRKKVLIIGLVFLTVTAAIYALFIAGLFTIFTVVSFVGWIQVVVALVALFFALVNIKDYFWYKEGVSFTISDEKKPGLYQRIRKVMDAGDSIWGLIGGTIILAAGVSLVEFSCTAGFPVLWTNLVAAQKVTTLTFILLLLLYMFIYQLDELGIFLAAVFTLKSNKLEEKQGRILKLIGGVLMLTLAIVMLVKPSVMSDIGQSLIVFGIAFAATLLILLVHRVILPALGVRIGTEYKKPSTRRRKH